MDEFRGNLAGGNHSGANAIDPDAIRAEPGGEASGQLDDPSSCSVVRRPGSSEAADFGIEGWALARIPKALAIKMIAPRPAVIIGTAACRAQW